MNGKRAYWKLLMAGAGVGAGLFTTNCTIKTATDDGAAGANSSAGTTSGTGGTSNGTAGTNSGTAGTNNSAAGADDGACLLGSRHFGCTCAGNLIGAQTCLSDGSFGACVCAMGSGDAGGTSGTGTGGSGTATGGAGGYSGGGGSGGATACDAGIDPSDCYSCLSQLCAKEWAACSADNETTVANPGDPYCLSKSDSADPGQIELVLNCIAMERANGLVKRDVVRACGATTGDSPDPQFVLWAPDTMTPATINLMNCMADAPATPTDQAGAWATSANIPEDGSAPAPWAACTCAKISCTSGQ